MIAGLALGSDNKRYFRGKLPRLAIGTIILMPLLYGAMYLWAFWNPFGEVDKIPAAIVNLDTGATQNGEPLEAGDDVVHSLIESGELDLKRVSAEEAEAGLADGSFFFTITLPENFSRAIVSPEGSDPTKARLIFTFNDANNYLSTIIGQDASEQVINKINTTIGAKAVDQVLVMIEDSGSKLQEAVDGADELASGSVELDNGVGRAQSGVVELNNGVIELRSQLDQAITPALTELESNQLAQFNETVAGVVGQAESLLPLVVQAENSLPAQVIDDAIRVLRNSPDTQAREIGRNLEAGVQAFRNDVRGVGQLMEKLTADLRELESNLGVSQDGSLQAQLADIEQQIEAKLQELRSGLDRLANGTAELDSGMGRLKSGTDQLVSGMSELQGGLQEGLEQVPTWTPRQRVQTADTLSTPVNLVQDLTNEAPTFGTGFAPFFCSLALFVGGILCWMLLTPLQPRPVVSGLGVYRTAFASYVPALLVGALQATVLFLVIKFGLGLKATHALAMWPFMILISAAFLAMIQAFNAFFDIAIGRVVTLAFLMVQLISAGGIYPVPTTALPFQFIHPIDPMTYTVNGLRQLTVAHEIDARLPIAIAVLVGIIVVALSVTAYAVRRNRQYTMERLYPSIEV